MKKFYLPPQLNGIASHKNIKPLAKDAADFVRPDTTVTADYAADEFTQPPDATDFPQTSSSVLDPDVEQALKEYYEYISMQNKR